MSGQCVQSRKLPAARCGAELPLEGATQPVSAKATAAAPNPNHARAIHPPLFYQSTGVEGRYGINDSSGAIVKLCGSGSNCGINRNRPNRYRRCCYPSSARIIGGG
jgi:hypothetical protein